MNASRLRIEIRLVLAPVWSHAETVALMSKKAVIAVFTNAELGEDVGIVARELAENAVKYGKWSEGRQFLFALTSDGDFLEVELSSPCDLDSPHFARLRSVLAQLEHANARESYLARLAKVAENHEERGGLGLLRLAHEAACRLKATFEGDWLHVKARMMVPRPTSKAASE